LPIATEPFPFESDAPENHMGEFLKVAPVHRCVRPGPRPPVGLHVLPLLRAGGACRPVPVL
jgi:hypothetical protein